MPFARRRGAFRKETACGSLHAEAGLPRRSLDVLAGEVLAGEARHGFQTHLSAMVEERWSFTIRDFRPKDAAELISEKCDEPLLR